MLHKSRKIFFLNPETKHENDFIGILARGEYEVYPVHDVKVLLKALTFFDKSIVFVNTLHKYEDVEKLYDLIKNSPDLMDASICTYYLKDGLLTFDAATSSFANSFVPPSNSIRIDQKDGQKLLYNLFETAGAKGERRYIRVRCSEMEVSHISLQFNGEIYTGEINDISSIGLSCCIEKLRPIRKGIVFNDITIRLNNLRFKCDCVTVGHRGSGKNVTQILLFRNIDQINKIKLSAYIYESQQESFKKVISTLQNLY